MTGDHMLPFYGLQDIDLWPILNAVSIPVRGCFRIGIWTIEGLSARSVYALRLAHTHA